MGNLHHHLDAPGIGERRAECGNVLSLPETASRPLRLSGGVKTGRQRQHQARPPDITNLWAEDDVGVGRGDMDMGKPLDGQVAIVTGGGQGLGAALCWRLADEGCSVVVADLNEETASATAGAITQHLREQPDRRAISFKVDVTDEDQVAAMVDRTVEEFGRVDILVSNAGILFAGEVDEFPAGQWRAVIGVNLVGYFL